MGEKIIRVNMTNLTSKSEEVPNEWRYLGARGLTSTIVAKEVPPTCEPLGRYNKLVFAPGLLAATAAANSGRLSAGFKSPLTGGIKESNAGGTAAQKLERLGIKALIIEGQPADQSKYYGIHISKDGVTIKEETELVGKGNYQVIEKLSERFVKNIGVLTIGPAGEMRMAAANISNRDPDKGMRSHGRGGGGAVMGSKKVKFIAIDDTGAPGVTVAQPDKFKEQTRIFSRALLDHAVTGQALPIYGTTVLINILNEAGGLPTKNFRYGSVEHANEISGEKLNEIITERHGVVSHGCHAGCVIKCSQVYLGPDGQYVSAGFEYETIWALGANACIDNLDDISYIDHAMDDVGIDSIECANSIAVAMDAGVLGWGDGKEALRIVSEEICKGTPLGRIIGNGAVSVGRAYGITRVPSIKGQTIPAYDPRAVKGMGITYATSPMGADHTAGYAVCQNILKVGGFVDPLSKQGQVELSRNLQIATAAIDSCGFCIFVAFPALDIPECFKAMFEMVNARYGLNMSESDFIEMGKKILKTEHEFNLAAGFTNLNDRLPEFFEEEVPPHNAVWDFSGEEIDEFWNF